jgi:1-deoxy-D-xylulose-5-phosphate synthase
MQFLSTRGILDKGIKLRSMFLPDIFIDQDTPENMYKKAGLDSISIEEKILEALKSNVVLSKTKSAS